ncbi:MAG: 30S ribosomal protein S17 [Phycisphaerales bacterium]
MSTTANTNAPAKKTTATRVGLVESDKRTKTRKVVVANLLTHPKYGKIMRSRTVLHVHDEKNESVLGDLVEVAECRPISKTKRWTLVRIVQKGASMKFVGIEAPGKDKKD